MRKLFGMGLLDLSKLYCLISADQCFRLVCALTIQACILVPSLPTTLPLRPALQALLWNFIEIVLIKVVFEELDFLLFLRVLPSIRCIGGGGGGRLVCRACSWGVEKIGQFGAIGDHHLVPAAGAIGGMGPLWAFFGRVQHAPHVDGLLEVGMEWRTRGGFCEGFGFHSAEEIRLWIFINCTAAIDLDTEQQQTDYHPSNY